MKKLFLLITILSLIIYSSLYSQDYDDEDCDWAYIFSAGNDFTLGKVDLGSYYQQDNDETPVVGIGVEKFLNNRWSLKGALSIGINNSTDEGTNQTIETGQNELGLRVGANYYFRGIENRVISPYFGGWLSYISYSQSRLVNPQNGNTTEDEYSSSTFGIGATGGVYVRHWKDLGVSFGAGYNLGYFITPSSTIKTTTEGRTVEIDGPSRNRLTDCGGELMVRFDF